MLQAKKLTYTLMASFLLFCILLAGCGAVDKKAEMEKALVALEAPITKMSDTTDKWGEAMDGVMDNKMSNAVANQAFLKVSTQYAESAEAVKKVTTPDWLSDANKKKFDLMKKLYADSATLMADASKNSADILAKRKMTPQEVKQMSDNALVFSSSLQKATVIYQDCADGKLNE